jgi:hypothetical protein
MRFLTHKVDSSLASELISQTASRATTSQYGLNFEEAKCEFLRLIHGAFTLSK